MGKNEFHVEDIPDRSEPSEQVTTKLTEEELYIDRYKSEEKDKKGFWTGLFSKKEK